MAIRDLIPTRFTQRNVPVRRTDYTDPYYYLRRDLGRLFDDFFNDMFPVNWENEFNFLPSVDITESDKEVQVNAELPGIDSKDLHVTISNNVLTLRGEKRDEWKEKNGNFYHRERSYGTFQRNIPLPDEIESDKVEAEFKNGLLTVHLLKKPDAQRKTKKIEIKAA